MYNNQSEPPRTKLLLGTKRGLDELKTLLAASEPTNSPFIRKIVISVPEGLPELYYLSQASLTAIAEFFLIADVKSLNLPNCNPNNEPILESPEGQKAMLPNGGTVRLKTRKIIENGNQKSIGELHIKDHEISDYQQTQQIDFVTE
ncbi:MULTISPECIES: hypothetical protein [unclassified Anabaena]|uniref:hypothetical protein n=1 Tax=unclassified Anabaena TaxID=2619674 RepID=UPI0039C5D331